MREAHRLYSAAQRFLRVRRGDDEGLTLIELMVALVVFALASGGIAGGFAAAMKSTGTDRDRATASSLAQREMEIVRNDFRNDPVPPVDAVNPNPLPGGTAGTPLKIDGRSYTLTRVVQWLVTGVGKSPCDGGTLAKFPAYAVRISVDWANRAPNVNPVEVNTVLTPTKNTLASTYNIVTVKIVGADGKPNPNVPVTLKKGSDWASGATVATDLTAGDGCAVFTAPTTGAHVVGVNNAGWVDPAGNQLVSKMINVTTGSFQKINMSYDDAAAIPVRLAAGNYETFSSLPVSQHHTVPLGVKTVGLFNTNIPTDGNERLYTVSNPGTTTIEGLWPAEDGYAVWSGSCAASDPADSGGSRPDSILVEAGQTSNEAFVLLAPVTVTAVNGATPLAGIAVRARPVATDGCTSDEMALALGVTDAAGVVRSSLPAGSWILDLPSMTNDDDLTTPVLLPDATVHEFTVTVS